MLSYIRGYMTQYRRRGWWPVSPDDLGFLSSSVEVYGTQPVADYYAVDPGTVRKTVLSGGDFPVVRPSLDMQDFQWTPPVSPGAPGRNDRNWYLQRMAHRMGLESSLPWTRPTVRLFELANDLRFEGWDTSTGFRYGEVPGISFAKYQDAWRDIRSAGLPVTVIRHFTGMRSPRDLGNRYPSWSEFLLAELLLLEVTQFSPGSYSG